MVLKQAPKTWFVTYNSIITQFGFNSNPHDYALFIHHTNHGIVFLRLYMDDMIITSHDKTCIVEFTYTYIKSCPNR